MDRIKETFEQLKLNQKKAKILYLTFGFPSLVRFSSLIKILKDTPVDILEVGLPFSDPLADGSILQYAAQQAIKQGINIDVFFEYMGELSRIICKPFVVMTYYNLIFHYGVENFIRHLEKINCNGCMVVDLPIEEAGDYINCARKYNLNTIFFITPETSPKRAREIIARTTGFLYYVSTAGITGPRALNLNQIKQNVAKIKKITSLPVCVGFGVHTKQQVKELSAVSDGVIVGSAAAKFILKNVDDKNLALKFSKYLSDLFQ